MQLLVNIVVLAATYALISCGYVLIYRVSRVLNLAHGALMMLGAYLLLSTALVFHGNPLLSLVMAAALSLVVGILVYVFLMHRMTGQSVLAAVLATIALSIMLRGGIALVWSAQSRQPIQHLHVSNPTIAILGDAHTSACSLLLVVVTGVVYTLLFLFMRFSRWGLRMRAVGQAPLLAAQRGISLHGIYALAWALSTFTGAAAGVLLSLNSGLDSTMALVGLQAFPAALVGGLDSLGGALVGSAIVAVTEVLLIHYVDPLLSSAAPFLVLIVMLVIRPWGLFGTQEQLDRV